MRSYVFDVVFAVGGRKSNRELNVVTTGEAVTSVNPNITQPSIISSYVNQYNPKYIKSSQL